MATRQNHMEHGRTVMAGSDTLGKFIAEREGRGIEVTRELYQHYHQVAGAEQHAAWYNRQNFFIKFMHRIGCDRHRV